MLAIVNINNISFLQNVKILIELRENIKNPTQRGPERTKEQLEKKMSSLITSYVSEQLVVWQLQPLEKDSFQLDFGINKAHFDELKQEWFGRRILITNRHQWTTEEIILAYWGQPKVE